MKPISLEELKALIQIYTVLGLEYDDAEGLYSVKAMDSANRLKAYCRFDGTQWFILEARLLQIRTAYENSDVRFSDDRAATLAACFSDNRITRPAIDVFWDDIRNTLNGVEHGN